LLGTTLVALCWLPAVMRHWQRPAAVDARLAVDSDSSAAIVRAAWCQGDPAAGGQGNVAGPELRAPELAAGEDAGATTDLRSVPGVPDRAFRLAGQAGYDAEQGPGTDAEPRQETQKGGGPAAGTACDPSVTDQPSLPERPALPEKPSVSEQPAVPQQPALPEQPAELKVVEPAEARPTPAPLAPPPPPTAPTVVAAMPRELASTPSQFILPAASLARSAQLEDIARQADQQTVHGYELANRGACFAARAEFTAALRLVAQGLDNEQHTNVHSQALSAALTALKEVRDLLPSGAKLEAEMDLPAILAGHRTPVLRSAPADDLRPMAAVKSYFTFAQEQFALAAGHEVAGSMALAALGKLHAAMARQNCLEVQAPESKAIVFFHASLLVFPQNYLAANELGVLLAHCGSPVEARRALEHSVGVCRGSVNLANLAAVYQQLGQAQWALAAQQQAEAARQVEESRLRSVTGSAGGMVQWVPPAALAASGMQAADLPRYPQPAANAPRAGQPTPAIRPAAAPAVPPPAAPAGLTADEFPAPPVRLAIGCLPPEKGDSPHLCEAPSGPFRQMGTVPFFRRDIVLCQALGPAAPCPICGVDCSECQGRCRGWEQARAIAWQAYAQGEYAGHARLAHVPEYRIRVDDALEMMYRLTRDQQPNPYQLNVGDEVRVEAFADPAITTSVFILPDGTITLRLLGQVHAAGQSVAQLRDRLEELYKKYYKVPAITVTPTKFDTRLEDLRATVDRRAGVAGGQALDLRVTPEGTVALPAIGSVPAQGLTLPELQKEINERYRQTIEGIEVMPILTARAPRYVYVIGEVRTPGRYEMVGPTTILQAVSLAGSWNVGANLCQIVVFRRGDDWRLLASRVNLEGALRGKQACPPGEIWLNDSDVIIVPKSRILEMDDAINLAFTRGLYGVFPMYSTITFQKLSTI